MTRAHISWPTGGAAARAMTAALFVVALLLRVAVPAGWMPERTAAGVHLTPCPAAGPTMLADAGGQAMAMSHAHVAAMDAAMPMAMHGAHGGPGHDHGTGHDQPPCPFAAFGVAVAAPIPVPAPAPPLLAPAPATVPVLVAVGRGLAAPPPPATGPPAIG